MTAERQKRLRWILFGLGALVAVAGLVWMATGLESVQDTAMLSIAEARLVPRIPELPEDEDALHVIVCGSGSPMPSRERAQACVAVFAGGKGYVFDAPTSMS